MAPSTLSAVAPPKTAPATFINVHGFNDVYWRCEAPARAIGARTELIPKDEMDDVLCYPRDVAPFRWYIELDRVDGRTVTARSKSKWDELCLAHTRFTNRREVFPDLEGAAVWIRPCLARAAHARRMQEDLGVRIVAELDDNYVSDAKKNIYLQEWGDRERLVHMKAVCSMDAIVFSTEVLRDVYDMEIRRRWRDWFSDTPRSEWPKKPELFVCMNNVDEDDWPEPIPRDGPIRIGWMGSPSHVWDVDIAWNALRWAKENGAETWMIGFDPIQGMKDRSFRVNGELQITDSGKRYIAKWRKVGHKVVEWRQPEAYERFALPFDIGLCPLLTNEHTLCKSDVKFLEYTISGAATIAQNNAVYNRTIVHEETGLLVGSQLEMMQAVKRLMTDEKLRLELVANAQQYVREQRGRKQMQEEWMAVIDG